MRREEARGWSEGGRVGEREGEVRLESVWLGRGHAWWRLLPIRKLDVRLKKTPAAMIRGGGVDGAGMYYQKNALC